MDTPSTTQTGRHTRSHKSELEKFKLFYEFATPTKEVHERIRRGKSD